MVGPSFRWWPFFLMDALLFDTSFRYRRTFLFRANVLLATGFFCSFANSQFKLNRQWQCASLLTVDPLGFRLLRSLGTTQRYSRVLRLLCFPLSCQRSCCSSCWVCAVAIFAKSILTYSIFAIDDLLIERTRRFDLFGLLLYFFCIVGAPANRFNRLQSLRLCCIIFSVA